MTITIEDVEKARDFLRGKIVHTPTLYSRSLSEMTGANVYLKMESLQTTGAFKARGACLKLSSLSEEDRKNGVIAVSAGNHAQGVAYWAKELGIPATIVMPNSTPFTKVTRTEAHGARVVLAGHDLNTAMAEAQRLIDAEGLYFVHPYDDELIIAGQGTAGLEILEDGPEDLDAVFVPIGGGGLLGGVATVMKALAPKTLVVGVESETWPSMYQTLNDLPLTVGGQTLAEGIAVKLPGKLNLEIGKRCLDEIQVVPEIAIEEAVGAFMEHQRIIVEGAGAVPLAALMREKDRFAGKNVVLLVSGGNIDARIVSSILMRGLTRNGRLIRLRVEISDQPGSLAKITTLISEAGANIVEIYHERLFYDVPVKLAEVDFVIETRDNSHVRRITQHLKMAGYESTVQNARSGEAQSSNAQY